MNNKMIVVPSPILNETELSLLQDLEKRYEKLLEPNAIIKAGSKVLEYVPENIKNIGTAAGEKISEQEFINQALEYAANGFKLLEELSAKMTLSEKTILKKINSKLKDQELNSLEELCLVRTYDIAKIVNSYRTSNVLTATLEGASTGALGFVGIIPNIVLSTFLYFRAVQSVAMCYGYDIKNSNTEMEIASAVLMNAIDPKKDSLNNELTAMIGKFMIFTETTAVKQLSDKTYSAMIEHGGMALLLTRIRALANAAAKKALTDAGEKTLEQNVFKGILTQLGKNLPKQKAGNAMPVVGSVFGAFFDTSQMYKIINYADIFYSKRFIEEKENRIKLLFGYNDNLDPIVVDVFDEDLKNI